MAAPIDVDAHGVDALAHRLARVEPEVERWKAEPFAAPGARLDAAAHAPPIAELVGRLPRFALAQMLANAARREGRPMRADRRHHIDAKAERAAMRDQAFRRAGAALAIGEIVADHDVAGAEALGHDFGGEGLGAQRGQRLVEGNDEGLIEAER